MAENGENAPLAGGSRAGSADPLVGPERSRGGSNSRALKVAGLTTLACMLVASQVFVVYMVFDQRQQIHSLQKNADKMNRQLQAPQAAPIKMLEPMNRFHLMDVLLDAGSAAPEPKPKAPVKEEKPSVQTSIGVEEMMSLMEENFELPNFNDTILGNLQSLKRQMNQSNWKSFESWMGNWILFEMAQDKSVPPNASAIKTKCQMQAEARGRQLSLFHPVCDEQGRYQATQCWHSVGMCWCVDVQSGVAITGTATRDRYLECGKDRFEA
ncbi:H-2 class II histocompatibility antigen gamma chain-like isoform X2 [Dunckerocampus dactyliophorus]|uniref:H-2 class II histocompatibility antigen gamma chain-like isoform X2 n=1 Tax=Dunckerocampus dactyliophorus TaxID=161453 RepID=UPI0024066632|nr:H-2 class II histocompatibility antigen gamma chain-like isoform X2 [Dunckerocampus dactyliophorus]